MTQRCEKALKQFNKQRLEVLPNTQAKQDSVDHKENTQHTRTVRHTFEGIYRGGYDFIH